MSKYFKERRNQIDGKKVIHRQGKVPEWATRKLTYNEDQLKKESRLVTGITPDSSAMILDTSKGYIQTNKDLLITSNDPRVQTDLLDLQEFKPMVMNSKDSDDEIESHPDIDDDESGECESSSDNDSD